MKTLWFLTLALRFVAADPPAACTKGVCHPGYRCVINKGHPDGFCSPEPQSPSCYSNGTPCVTTSDCCDQGTGTICASNGAGSPICQTTACSAESLYQPNRGLIGYGFRDANGGTTVEAFNPSTSKYDCCLSCYQRPGGGCDAFVYRADGACYTLSNALGGPSGPNVATCPKGTANELDLTTNGVPSGYAPYFGIFGIGPCGVGSNVRIVAS